MLRPWVIFKTGKSPFLFIGECGGSLPAPTGEHPDTWMIYCGINFVKFASFFQAEGAMRNHSSIKNRPGVVTPETANDLGRQGIKPRVAPTAEEVARQKLRQEYENYLRHERGLSERTIRRLWYGISAKVLKLGF
jgi:hypothetical protein